jgi:hydroxymethylpyrimidine pyrophosphatase-like HAD family hydrolase
MAEDPWPEHTLRVGAIANESDLLPIATQLKVSLEGRAKLQHWSAVTCSQATGSSTHLLEVFGNEVSKWAMLERYLGEKLKRERIVAIGDGLNDIEVLREAGLSIVMENANEEVQQYADVLAGHHDSHGFAHAMRRWIIPEGVA